MSSFTAFTAAVIVLMLSSRVMDFVATWSDGYAPPFSISRFSIEMIIYFGFILMLAYLVGLLHGWTFGNTHIQWISAAAAIPTFFFWFVMSMCTYGLGLLALPVLIGFYWIINYGVKVGAKFPHACSVQ